MPYNLKNTHNGEWTIDLEIPRDVQPEYLLWVQVVYMAVHDFCNFAEWYCKRLINEQGTKVKRKSNTTELAMIRELRALEWFLFYPVAEPFNLEWIGENVFSSGTALCGSIRAKCEAAHKAALDVYASSPELAPLVDLYRKRFRRSIHPKSLDDADLQAMAREVQRRHLT